MIECFWCLNGSNRFIMLRRHNFIAGISSIKVVNKGMVKRPNNNIVKHPHPHKNKNENVVVVIIVDYDDYTGKSF